LDLNFSGLCVGLIVVYGERLVRQIIGNGFGNRNAGITGAIGIVAAKEKNASQNRVDTLCEHTDNNTNYP
jgi:hypothetical protein